MNIDESVAVGAMTDGTVVFYNPDTPAGIRRLGPARNDLTNLAEQAQIPTLSQFVKELLGAEQDPQEVQP